MSSTPPVRVSFLGGLGEIGRNMAAIEIDGEVGVVDVGVFFPNPEHLGVDLILADWASLRDRNVTSVWLTHGHLDHIGALPYFLQDFPDVRIYGTKLTLAFCEANLEEWPDIEGHTFIEVSPGDVVHDGNFEVEVVQVSHSIPDGCAFAFRTPHGLIVHSGDFKMDQTPIDDLPTDLAHFARLGDEGIDLLLADSTNADVPGHVPTERVVGKTLRDEIRDAEGLVVITSFASHIHRVQQVLDAAVETGRRPIFLGRSMIKNMKIARELGYVTYDPELEVFPKEADRYPREELIVICTGSQGEPYSALSLMASGNHRDLELGDGDLVILASSLIPGNEHAVYRSINGLARRGARVIHKGLADVHVSGHANREDLVLFHNVLEPEYVVPVHGEYRHLLAHRDIAVVTGCPDEHVFICEDGDVIELEDGVARRGEPVQAGQVFVDGLLQDVGPAVLRHRGRLSEDGVCVCVVTVDPHKGVAVGEPMVMQYGVIFEEESAHVLEAAAKAVSAELAGVKSGRFDDIPAMQRHVTQALGTFWRAEVGRRPVILPVVLEA